MRSRRRTLRGVAAVAALAALAACGHGGTRSPSPTAPPSGAPAAPAATGTAVPIHIETHGDSGQFVTIVQSLHGRKLYTIRALSTDVQSAGTNQGTGQLDQPHVTFVDRHGSTTIADAPKAHLVERDKTVVMTGGVHANTSTGTILTCDTLTYSGATERFHGEGNVVLSARDGMHLEGQHLDGDTRLQEVSVTGGARP